ncbi:hypothetical protein [Lentzea sp. NPDC059081]|uniref:hypothetical protein n=1 Tax=Lentzea sp. NPDC059081 TaxID=3346719 RepID=UPI0036B0E92C
MSAAAADAPGDPVDSILWLRNGGGKSSLLSLFFALVLPLRKDFMGKSVDRYLEDYIASGDTSHTVAEWAAQPDGGLLPTPRLITGAVYEWADQRKPIDPDRDRDKLNGWYYTFFAVPGVLDLDHLPVHDETGRTRTMADFVRLLKEVAATRPQQLSFAITDQRKQWMETLTARNLDPALFGYQKQMNHSEGGVAELFKFNSTSKFVDFLVDLTVDPAEPDLVATNLRKIIEVIGRKKDLRVDRDFCAEMAGRLDSLAQRFLLATKANDEAARARVAAARLAGAFRRAAEAHESDYEWFAAEEERLRAEALKLDRERNRVNDVANELFRIAATHRQAAALEARDTGESLSEHAEAVASAWEAVGPLADLAEAEAESVRRQMDEEERQSAPLRARRDVAAATLKARYAALAVDEREAWQIQAMVAGKADEDAEAEEGRAQRNKESATGAEVRAEQLRGRVVELRKAVEAAVSREDLPDPEADPAVVLAQYRAAKREANTQLGDVRQRRAARPVRRRALVDHSRRLTAELAARRAEREQLLSDHGRLVERADALAVDARLAELVQLEDGGRLDLWAEAADLRTALTHAVALAESTIVDTRVDAAEDDRALEGLRGDAFLPTTRDAQRAAEMIASVSSDAAARPGWELFRDLVPEAGRIAALENPVVAELAAGVVITGIDVARARAALEEHGWRSVAHVAVATAAQMEQALHGIRPEWWSVASDPALFDAVAADGARVERELRRHGQDQRIAGLHEQSHADRALLATLETLLNDCPAGHLAALEKTIDDLRQVIDDTADADEQLREQITELDENESSDADAERELTGQLTSLEGRINRLETLAVQVAELPGIETAIKQFDRDVQTYNGIAEQAAGRAKELRKAERDARRQVESHRARSERYEQEGRAISLLDAEHHVEVSETGEPLSLLQSRFIDLESQWRTVAAQSVLAERLDNIARRGERARRELAGCPDAIRERAKELLDTGEGQDGERRASARTRARQRAADVRTQLNHLEFELEQAKQEVAARTPRDRLRHAQLDVEPVTEEEARCQADENAAMATEMSGRVTTMNREADEARDAASGAGTLAQVLVQRAHRLADAAAPAIVPQTMTPFDGDDVQAETATQTVLDALAAAAGVAVATGQELDQATLAVRKLASETRFSTIPDAIRDRFTGDDSEVLAERAASRAQEMRVRRTTIEGQLADIGRDQQLVVSQIAGLVQVVLANLESANRHSKLPGTLGGWANEQFLRIRFVRPASEEDLHARIDAVVDRIVGEKSKPEGLALVKRCVHEAVAPRGFTVKVLKPNSDLAVEPVDVTRLGKFSGGEKLTVCVALYCTLARLRAVNRGRGKVALGGTLVLDNPLGTASHVALLRLQRDVAAAHGVQLVYMTGVEDLGAVGQFPNVLRMRNTPGALRTRRYVVLEDRFGSEVEGITSVRVAQDPSTDGVAS